MAFDISFAKRHSYSGSADSITIPVVLKAGRERVDFVASLDTGAAYCVFRRTYAEALGLEVERGVPMSFATANSRFQAFGHEVTISTLDIEVRHGWLDRLNVGIVDHDQLLFLGGY